MQVGVDAVITGPRGNTINRSRTDTVEGGGDLYPLATLRWTREQQLARLCHGRHAGGCVPGGRLANIGLNHWSLDAGGGYTYLDAKAGHEFSIVAGFTYNFENEDTNYQNGVDGHIDWAASQFLNEQLHIGLVGYIYYQLSGDSGKARCSATSSPASIQWDRRPDIFSRRRDAGLHQSSRLLRVRCQ